MVYQIYFYILLGFSINAASAQPRYHLTGSIKGKSVNKVRVSFFDTRPLKEKNVIIVSNKFSFSDTISSPLLCKISFPEFNSHVNLYLDTGKINLQIKIDSVVYNGHKMFVAKIENEVISNIESVHEYTLNSIKAIEDSSIGREIKRSLTYNLFDSLIRIYPNYIFLGSAFTQLDNISYLQADGFYKKLNSKLKEVVIAYGGIKFLDRLKKTEPGTVFQYFNEKDTSGSLINIKDAKFKYILINFGSSTCGPCREQFPALKTIYNTYNNKGFSIVGNYLESSKEGWIRSLKTDKLPWKTVSSLEGFHSSSAVYYGLTYIPYNILINSRMEIIGRNYSPTELNEKLKQLLK